MRTRLFSTGQLPLVIEPDPGEENRDSLLSLVAQNRAFLEESLLKHGGILFRGFTISSPADFQTLVRAIDSNAMSYVAGTSPRAQVLDQVYTSTEVPAAFKLHLHNEMSYRREFPKRIFFYCSIPAAEDGETIIGDSRRIHDGLPSELVGRFTRHGVTYKRTLMSLPRRLRRVLHVLRLFPMITWQEVFKTEDKAEVEAQCRASGIRCRWQPNGDLLMTETLQPVITHPQTGEKVWFTSAHLFQLNPRAVGKWLFRFYWVLLKLVGRPTSQCCFGDETPIDNSDISTIVDALEKNEVYFQWQKNDVLMLDNVLAAHGRNRYRGKRKILVSMTGQGERNPP